MSNTLNTDIDNICPETKSNTLRENLNNRIRKRRNRKSFVEKIIFRSKTMASKIINNRFKPSNKTDVPKNKYIDTHSLGRPIPKIIGENRRKSRIVSSTKSYHVLNSDTNKNMKCTNCNKKLKRDSEINKEILVIYRTENLYGNLTKRGKNRIKLCEECKKLEGISK